MSAAVARKSRRTQYTEQDYLHLEGDSPIKHEYLDGEIYAMAGAKPGHNLVASNTTVALGNLVAGGLCGVFGSDQRIHVTSTGLYTYADGGVACGRWEISDKDDMSLLNPVLLFEVLSPSTRDYDRGEKLAHYLKISTVKDVLLIEQPERLVEHHHRGPKGWKSTARHRGGIPLLGGMIRVEDLYRLIGRDGAVGLR